MNADYDDLLDAPADLAAARITVLALASSVAPGGGALLLKEGENRATDTPQLVERLRMATKPLSCAVGRLGDDLVVELAPTSPQDSAWKDPSGGPGPFVRLCSARRVVCFGHGRPLLVRGEAIRAWLRDYDVSVSFGVRPKPGLLSRLLGRVLPSAADWDPVARAAGADVQLFFLRVGTHFGLS